MELKDKKIGIIGGGFVGGAIHHGFRNHFECRIYDIDKDRATHTLNEVLDCEFIFVCLPTPMSKALGGPADMSILDGFFENVKDKKSKGHFIIKSTVPVGTTSGYYTKYKNLIILHSPEFLSAKTAKIDFITPARIIVGYTCKYSQAMDVKELFEYRFKGVQCHIMNSDDSEMVKYMCNNFYAVKISFFNEMRLLADKLNMNWDNIMEGVLSSHWITPLHVEISDERYYGNFCFPKDINAMIATMEENGIDPLLLKASWQQVLNHRKVFDWIDLPSVVSKKGVEEYYKDKK